jgi:enoyl-CoA hydratase/carnithine racemase
MSHVLVDVDERGVALVTLNRPERKNALSFPMLQTFIESMWSLDADGAVRVIVVTGAGDAFCSGLDLSQAAAGTTFRFAAAAEDDHEHNSQAVADRVAFWRMRTPVLAAINGAAIGAGLTLPMQADIRYVADDAALRFPFVRFNLIPEANSTWLLPRIVGASRALELLLSGRWFTGAEAASMGMASAALPAAEVLPATLELAREIATYCGPLAVGLTKQLVHRALQEPDRTTMCTLETKLTMWTGTLPDTAAGIGAMRSRGEPTFTGSKHAPAPDGLDPLAGL